VSWVEIISKQKRTSSRIDYHTNAYTHKPKNFIYTLVYLLQKLCF